MIGKVVSHYQILTLLARPALSRLVSPNAAWHLI